MNKPFALLLALSAATLAPRTPPATSIASCAPQPVRLVVDLQDRVGQRHRQLQQRRQPAGAASNLDCQLRYNLSGWSLIYKTASGNGSAAATAPACRCALK